MKDQLRYLILNPWLTQIVSAKEKLLLFKNKHRKILGDGKEREGGRVERKKEYVCGKEKRIYTRIILQNYVKKKILAKDITFTYYFLLKYS